jgi:hypothetical protein
MVFCLKGIENVSQVSCHLSCAIQILCHAIPPIQQVLSKLLEKEVAEDANDDEKSDTAMSNTKRSISNSTGSVLLNELLDFVRDDHKNSNMNDKDAFVAVPEPTVWNPQRLYTYWKVCNCGVDFEEVGDPSITLIKLLHLLLKEAHDGNNIWWEQLLMASVWEGQTRQILEGRKRIIDTNNQQYTIQRTKLGKIKAMSCPMVLKATIKTQQHRKDPADICHVEDLLKHITKPQLVQGAEYPWDQMEPETYTETLIRVVVDSNNNNITVLDDNDDKHNIDSEEEDNPVTTTWITTKRIEFHRLPRVWLLHLDRIKPYKLPRNNIVDNTDDDDHHHDDVSHGHYINVPVELDQESLQLLATRSGDETSPPPYTLQGAILNVMEMMDNDDEVCLDSEEDLEVHSVVLLRQQQQHQQQSWMLIDDEKCELVENDRALKLLGGIVEHGQSISKDSNCRVYYGATLLVYAIANDDLLQRDWIEIAEAIQRSTKYPAQVTDFTLDAWQLVGRRLKVKWAKGKYYPGIITKYDTSSGKHQILYDDGDVREYTLSKKTIQWI